MNQVQFDKITEGLVNPSRIKVAVAEDYDLLMSAENTNDTMAWFKTNADKLEERLRSLKLQWAYAIETTPNGEPFIYMLISPNMNTSIAQQMTKKAERTLPDDRQIHVSAGLFRTFDIDQYDHTPVTLLEELLSRHSGDVFKVSEV